MGIFYIHKIEALLSLPALFSQIIPLMDLALIPRVHKYKSEQPRDRVTLPTPGQ